MLFEIISRPLCDAFYFYYYQSWRRGLSVFYEQVSQCEQVSQLQAIVQEKEENEKAAAQKLAMYQNQLHAKNNEVATLKDQLQAQVCPKYCQWRYSP